ncbi:cytochrome P450 [Hygrophoropsis aurantiaca]|uniref:Cytochrome P450 n=1 Tax=Hygrophoropsis aurantiaca TaxID=72124 RepID=A0ACB8A5V7_9AGAM|nr:cytochrome P450 [Hygrophoropsis aurantiaca]
MAFSYFDFVPQDLARLSWVCAAAMAALLIQRVFTVPAHLRHLPRVPMLALLISYLSGDTEDVRIKRHILPYANEQGEGLVLVWALGRWMVHILDYKLAAQMSDNMSLYPKELPPDGLLLWRFIGNSNVLMTNGDKWRKHSRVIRDAFALPIPIDLFASLAKNLFAVISPPSSPQRTHTVDFSELAQRFALDAVGSSVLGHDFDAIRTESLFVREYNGIMHDIANPVYLIAPFLERIFPRKEVIRRMDSLVDGFKKLLQAKKDEPGDDMMTLMLKDPEMTDEELRDNMVVLFIAGHDTSAGGLSTLIYYLAIHPEIQEIARQEVLRVLGASADPSVGTLSATSLPYLNACIREALRINTPISYIVPRAPVDGVTLGKYYIPPNTSLIYNIYAVHHNDDVWGDPNVFRPARFLEKGTPRAAMNKDAWVPFATGARQCPARNFALYEQRALAVMLLREYEWTLPEASIHAKGLKNAFSPFALTLPHDLHVTFTKRQS